jgi:D-alanine-D-alanine ligase
MNKIRVGVIRGGVGSEYEVSLKTGGSVLKNLPEKKYRAFDILITKDGQWNIDGFPTTPAKLSRQVDVVFNALHGEYGEDGKVQKELEQFTIPYTGSGVFASAVAMNKALAKYYFKQAGLKTPECALIKGLEDFEELVYRAFKKFPGPFVVKPISSGSSVGVSVARDFEGLLRSVEEALNYNRIVLIEEYIDGREITCGVIDSIAGGEPYATHPVEIITPESSDFFDYEVKYNGETLEICPANLFPSTTAKIQDLAIRAHKALGMRHYSRSDFILSKRGIHILETNSLPGLTKESLLPKALKMAGLEFPEFLDYILTLAIDRK